MPVQRIRQKYACSSVTLNGVKEVGIQPHPKGFSLLVISIIVIHQKYGCIAVEKSSNDYKCSKLRVITVHKLFFSYNYPTHLFELIIFASLVSCLIACV